MIYLDNAATTLRKPDCVVEAVCDALKSLGNAGRGVHSASLDASRIIYDTRCELAKLFHVSNPSNISFTCNATESLNIALKGILNPSDHVITTELEHNSVLRPLYELENNGVELSFLKSDKTGCIKLSDIEDMIKENTKAIVCTHASNLTGNIVDIEKVGAIAKKHNILFIVDASQTAGVFDIDVDKMNIDFLCFTGHKSLMGPQGTGGIYVKEGVDIKPLKSGGSGIETYLHTHPRSMPTKLEAGTLNVHGLAGLRASLKYIQEIGLETIRNKEQDLMWYFYQEVSKIDGIKIYGDFTSKNRCPIVTLNVKDYDSSLVSDVLYQEHGISTRSGAHCAPLMHMALGTKNQGAVRFSFSYFNTYEELDVAIKTLRNIVE